MKRKLVKQGVSTMMISLPTKWIKQNGLDKGDEIDLEETGKDLTIRSHANKENKKIVVNVSGLSPLINRVMISKYIQGHDELEIRFEDPAEIKDFQKRVINELIGFEIIKQTQGSLFIKDITGAENQEIDDLIKRVFFILDSMADELVIALEKNKNLDPIMETDIAVNKFVHFCLRMLNKKGYKNQSKTEEMYVIVSSLEEIGDEYKRIAKDSKKIKATREYITIIKDLRKQLTLFKEILFDYDKEKLVEYAKNYEKIKEDIKEIKNKTLIDFHIFQINETIIKLNNYFLAMSDVGVV